ncbi:ATP-binding protein [Geminicoccus roseus]|uniref:ATP-binding protein n=1 Tax=Geminicoccus roseus TaxID=404900 RepID=UPI00068917EC|nr:ATP-binding protein [Geminicoccus roseus]
MRPPEEKSGWFRVYILLVTLNIAVIVGGAYLGRTIKQNHDQSVQANHRWVERLASYSDLARLAGAVNAPGNDVFDSLRLDQEIQLRDRARTAFDQELAEARAELIGHVQPERAVPLLAWLDEAEAVMARMVSVSDQLFDHLARDEPAQAAARMASMDRAYGDFAEVMAGLNRQVGQIQTHEFGEQIAAMRRLDVLELVIGGLVVAMVVGMTFYGYKIVQKLQVDEEKLERYSASLAEARDAADASNRAKSVFLALVSHEIGTPLTAVLGSADLIAAAKLPEETRATVRALQTSGRHLMAIVQDILDFSRLEAGEFRLEPVDFRVAEVLEQVEWLTAPAAAERGIGLRFDSEIAAGPVLRGDPTRLRQVLLNLVGNAIKFTVEGEVRVETTIRPQGRHGLVLQVAVTDTGIGIRPEEQARLFQPFCQAGHAAGRRDRGGTGLGLAICRRLVEAMGGSIELESRIGEGSRFRFAIPFEAGDRRLVEEQLVFGPASCPPRRILVVDDAAPTRALLAKMLALQGHETVGAADGAQAVQLASEQRFDVVLMDLQMPVMDGFEATRRIRSLPAPGGRVPILGLTAGVVEAQRGRCLEAGMERCLGKPFAWAELFTAIAQVSASAPESAPAAPVSEASLPLFDRFGVHLAVDAHAEDLLQQVIEDAERIWARLAEGPLPAEVQAAEAHKLKGSSGLFGLKRIREAADRLLDASSRGLDSREALDSLARAVAATRTELQLAGLVEPVAEPAPEAAPSPPAGPAAGRAALPQGAPVP